MDYTELIELFQSNADKGYKDFNGKIVNSGVKMIGCTVPFVRKVAQKYFSQPEKAFALPTHEYFEVDLLKGMSVSRCNLPFAQKKEYLIDFADTVENWAVCDCCAVKVPKVERREYFHFFRQLCSSNKPFVCRYGFVNLLSNFLDIEYIDEVFDTVSQPGACGYYVDMAVAWLVATAMVHCRDKTVNFLEGKGREVLTEFAYNKALQKMRDSFRVSEQDKEWSKKMKR